VRFQRRGDLHRCQYEAAKRIDHEIDRHILRRVFVRCNYCLRIFQIDMAAAGNLRPVLQRGD